MDLGSDLGPHMGFRACEGHELVMMGPGHVTSLNHEGTQVEGLTSGQFLVEGVHTHLGPNQSVLSIGRLRPVQDRWVPAPHPPESGLTGLQAPLM